MKRDELLDFLLWLYRTEDGKSEIPVCNNLIDIYCDENGVDLDVDDSDDEIILDESCPNCHNEYDEIDYEYQICHICKFNNNKP